MYIDWTLLKRSMISGLSAEEQQMLEEWLEESPEHRELYRNMKAFWTDRESFRPGEERMGQFRSDFEQRMGRTARKRQFRRIFRQVGVAASLVLALGVAAVLYWQITGQKPVEVTQVRQAPAIAPGKPRAILVTQDGKAVNLTTELPSVEIAQGIKVDNRANALIYSDSLPAEVDQEENQLVVPRGGEYAIRLSDGTQVWLNSASELRYPVHFAGNVRQVYLKGEAYFQVAHDQEKAFIVVTDEVNVRVYGTEFNINTRAAGCIQTTLVNGSVSIQGGRTAEQMLRPDQMAEYRPEDGTMAIREVDVTNYIGWKSGIYMFENRTVEQILEELALWYDVEIFFQNNASRTSRFSGSLPRYREINEMLSVISKTSRVRFEVKGRTVIVK